MPSNKDYVAIVYEHVADGENGHGVVGELLEFLWLTGFSLILYGYYPFGSGR